MFVYVDDILLFNFYIKTINSLKYKLSDTYKMINCKSCKHYLNMTIKQDQQLRTLTVFQKMYLEKVLDYFKFSDLRLTVTFIKQNLKLKVSKKQTDTVFIK